MTLPGTVHIHGGEERVVARLRAELWIGGCWGISDNLVPHLKHGWRGWRRGHSSNGSKIIQCCEISGWVGLVYLPSWLVL